MILLLEYGDHLLLRTIPPKTLLFARSVIKKNNSKLDYSMENGFPKLLQIKHQPMMNNKVIIR